MAGGASRGRCSVWLCAACRAPLQGQLGSHTIPEGWLSRQVARSGALTGGGGGEADVSGEEPGGGGGALHPTVSRLI